MVIWVKTLLQIPIVEIKWQIPKKRKKETIACKDQYVTKDWCSARGNYSKFKKEETKRALTLTLARMQIV